MKIIRTPLDWESNPDDDWLHSVDYIESADINVDELDSESRTGTVTFTQDETSDQKEVTVIQKRATFYYSVGTNYGPGATFNIGGELVVSDENGVATRVWTSTPGSAAPESMVATPETDIRALAVNPSLVEFPAEGGDVRETFIWTDWDKTGVTVHRSANAVPQVSINTASTTITSVTEVSGPNWLTLNNNGDIHANVNTGSERTGFVEYINCGKTATVQVIQREKPITEKYFGVKTTSNLAEGQHVIFTVDGEDLQPVNFSERGEYYIAIITASPEASVSVSCDISDFTIGVSPGELYFGPDGETKTVNVDAEKRLLQANHQILTGYTDLSDLSGLYTIEESVTVSQYYSEIVSGEGFSIYANSITASPNITHSGRTGQAKFTHMEDGEKFVFVTLRQENVNWFSFKSTVNGSPNTGRVIFSNLPAPYPSSETIDYEQQTDNTQYLEKTYTGNVQHISYKIEGFEETTSISVDKDYVVFEEITMELSGNRYKLSGTTEDVVVTADGTSYEYQEKINGQIVSPPSLTGIIPANSELEFNATANTTNDFTITKTYSGSTSGDWECNVATGTPTTITVKTIAPIPIASQKILTLKYTLDKAPEITAQTIFIVPTGATSNINLENFILSSTTAFGMALSGNQHQIPTGSNAYVFAFWPPSRTAMTLNATDLEYIHYADIRYNKPSGDYNGWMLYYPLTRDGNFGLPANYVAKVYALTYGNGVTYGGQGNQDRWTLGPLMYRESSGANVPYYEVDGFKFLSANTDEGTLKVQSTGIKVGESGHSKTYPSVCPFSATSDTPLSASSEYFGFFNPAHGSFSATNGTISNDKRQITIEGKAVGGLPSNTGSTTGTNKIFYERVRPMIERNSMTYHNSTAQTNCSTHSYNTRGALANVIYGNVLSNILGPITINMIYFGRYGNMQPDVPATGSTWYIPADSHVVTPRNPGDTTSVIYDAETNTYLVYDIDSVIVLDRATSIVVPEADLIDFKVPVDDEIIAPPHP